MLYQYHGYDGVSERKLHAETTGFYRRNLGAFNATKEPGSFDRKWLANVISWVLPGRKSVSVSKDCACDCEKDAYTTDCLREMRRAGAGNVW